MKYSRILKKRKAPSKPLSVDKALCNLSSISSKKALSPPAPDRDPEESAAHECERGRLGRGIGRKVWASSRVGVLDSRESVDRKSVV